mgnify:CR=1 FL=1
MQRQLLIMLEQLLVERGSGSEDPLRPVQQCRQSNRRCQRQGRRRQIARHLFARKRNAGKACAVLDADITGPSIPKSFGIKGRAKADETGLLPEESKTGIKIMSVNLLLESEDSPVVWRGPVISGVIQQFWKDVAWGDVDYMFVDMPPGTGDVPLTVFQNLPVDGIIIVTTPQELVTMIVKKAYNMAKLMNIPVLGIVENMSYAVCPDCGKEFSIFGESHIDEVAEELGVPVLARLPIDPRNASLVDKGAVELADDKYIAGAVEALLK